MIGHRDRGGVVLLGRAELNVPGGVLPPEGEEPFTEPLLASEAGMSRTITLRAGS